MFAIVPLASLAKTIPQKGDQMQEGKKRKTTTSREVRNRYDAKTYKSINFRLRIEDDAEILKSIEEAQAQGLKNREWLRQIFYK